MLTILIPCFNEETLIEKTFTQVNKSLKILDIKNYEIIFIDDGSTDKSFEKINEIAKIDERVITIKNKRNYGLGYNIQKGIRISRGDYFIFIPGDNSHSSNEIIKILEFINSNYDLITTYYSNRSEQSFLRHIFTRLYTPFLNFLYGTNFYYFNGLTLYKTKDLKNLKFINNSFSFQIEIFVYLFYKKNLKLKVVPTLISERESGSKAFRLKNSISVIYNIKKIFIKSIYYRILRFINNRKN